MSVGSAIYRLLIGPLELLFEVIYSLAYHVLGNAGLSIVFLSLAMNFLVLPLYRRADILQAEQRETELRLKPWADHIKKTFTGDERFMMLQTYYRQNGYKQTDALKGSVSLLLEVPFFLAAYRFLSGLQLLHGVSFGPIRDMGLPDGLLSLGGVSINVLPILMTVINLISAAVYMKGFPLKNKLQMVGMALVFLVLLYSSPAGLVFYWTLNNIFSLLKNIFYKLKNPRRVLRIMAALAGAAGFAWVLLSQAPFGRRKLLLILALLALELPLLLSTTGKRQRKLPKPAADRRMFLLACVFLTILLGLLIPSALIGDSPQEFVDPGVLKSPAWSILGAFLLAAGSFLLWARIFYELASEEGKGWLGLGLYVLASLSAVDYLFFGTHYGNLNSLLQYDVLPEPGSREILLNLAVLALTAAALVWLWRKKPALGRTLILAAILAAAGMSIANGAAIRTGLAELERTQEKAAARQWQGINLSRDGNNVVVLMMDRAIGYYLPYLLAERPELEEQFAGFTFYPNTLSYGKSTNTGSPVLYGGYEYTPEEMNRRAEESLESKQNEALKVMPVLFDQAGYQVTVINPTYAGYQWLPDVSIYDDYPEIYADVMTGRFDLSTMGEEISGRYRESTSRWNAAKAYTMDRNLFSYGIFRAAPVLLHPTLYNQGYYNSPDSMAAGSPFAVFTQHAETPSVAKGTDLTYIQRAEEISQMSAYTHVRDDIPGAFVMMANEITHSPCLLQEPDYSISFEVDNREYDAEHALRPGPDGSALRLENVKQMKHYHINMSALILLGDWLDYLKEQGVYDNTRIIIVADHGYGLRMSPEYLFGQEAWEDVMCYNPLLLVKDFGSGTGVTVDRQFMTNGDVPTLALAGLIEDPHNPFTGKPINSNAKFAGAQRILVTDISINKNNGNTFLPGQWYLFSGGDVLDASRWTLEGVH